MPLRTCANIYSEHLNDNLATSWQPPVTLALIRMKTLWIIHVGFQLQHW